MNRKLLINQKFLFDVLSDDKITVIDGGARGELFYPLNQVDPSLLSIVRFEPDPQAKINHGKNEISSTA